MTLDQIMIWFVNPAIVAVLIGGGAILAARFIP
jgi:hypothetical protein